MKEVPILFKSELVKAILDGRKTQTRRIIKPFPDWNEPSPLPEIIEPEGWQGPLTTEHWADDCDSYDDEIYRRCRFGPIGTEIWVRETWSTLPKWNKTKPSKIPKGEPIWYHPSTGNTGQTLPINGKWRPSIFMPRWASRIQLKVANIMAQQLWYISESDARAEGAEPLLTTPYAQGFKEAFCELWDSVNGKKKGCSWADNPWVFAISFKRIRP